MVVRDDVVAHRCAEDRVVFDQRILMSASSCLFASLSHNCQPAEDGPCGSDIRLDECTFLEMNADAGQTA